MLTMTLLPERMMVHVHYMAHNQYILVIYLFNRNVRNTSEPAFAEVYVTPA